VVAKWRVLPRLALPKFKIATSPSGEDLSLVDQITASSIQVAAGQTQSQLPICLQSQNRRGRTETHGLADCFRMAQNYRPMLIVMCPSAATERNILFSFEADLLRRMKLDWSNRAASVAPPCIRVSSVRQESHRRAADDHFHPSRKTGRDWPVMPTIRTQSSVAL